MRSEGWCCFTASILVRPSSAAVDNLGKSVAQDKVRLLGELVVHAMSGVGADTRTCGANISSQFALTRMTAEAAVVAAVRRQRSSSVRLGRPGGDGGVARQPVRWLAGLNLGV